MFLINFKQNQIKSPFWIILCKKIMIYLNSESNSGAKQIFKNIFLTLIIYPVYLHFDSIDIENWLQIRNQHQILIIKKKISVGGGPLEWLATDRHRYSPLKELSENI